MPTRNVNLTDDLDSFIAAKVASGKYENASEVVRAALRALEEREQARELWVQRLRAETIRRFDALDRGEGIEVSVDELMDEIDAELASDK
jgi:antitoxin ParD1/3/4